MFNRKPKSPVTVTRYTFVHGTTAPLETTVTADTARKALAILFERETGAAPTDDMSFAVEVYANKVSFEYFDRRGRLVVFSGFIVE